jgi:mono/diheme cytochrome c family protein
LTVFRFNLQSKLVPFRRIWLIPLLGAALFLAGTVLVTVRAAPPDQAPEGKPSASRGEALWTQNCAPCHGAQGRGDGPTAQMPQMADHPPTDFSDEVAARQRSLAYMFTVTKEGRMDRLMPPWGGQLSDDQIWDVVAYAQTFATTPDEIAAGKSLYEANCTTCHANDGTAAAPGVPNLADAAQMASRSPQALFDMVSQGEGDMPAFASQLSEQERWQVVDYLRTFSYQPIASDGIITGQVQNATIGQSVGNVEVRLRRWGIDSELPSLTTKADADGHFRFENLDTGSHSFYNLEVLYNGISFPSEFASFDPGSSELSMPVNVYETTTSDEAVKVDRLHFIVMGNQPGSFSVLELYQFSNDGDLAYVGRVNDAGQRETVRIALPAGAQDLFLQRGTLGVDFLKTDNDLVSTSVIVPGQDSFEVAFVYLVPYSGTSLDLNRPVYYDTSIVNGLVLDMGAKLESDVLTFGGERSAQGQNYLQYTAQELKAGETLPVRLNELDKVQFSSASSDTTSNDSPAVLPSTGLRQTTLLLAMLGLGTLIIVFGVFYPRLRLRLRGEGVALEGDLRRERQRLLLTLARLDQAYEAGQLNETVYQRARAQHKAELVDVLQRLQEEGA